MAYEDRRITGSTSGGSVWGSNPYTDDSDYAVAAVHAGILQPGETKYIRITDLGTFNAFTGTTRNGVTTRDRTTNWDAVFLTLVGDIASEGSLGSSYGYDDWYEEFAGTTLKNISKTTALNIAYLLSIFYTSNTEAKDDKDNTWYGLFRKPDAEGLAYWTKQANDVYGGNFIVPQFVGEFYGGSGPGDLDYNRARSSSKSFLSGTGYGDFYDRGSKPSSVVAPPGPPATPVFNGLSKQETEQLVLNLYASIGRGPNIGDKLSDIDQNGRDFWNNRILEKALTVQEATTEFNAAVEDFIANNPNDPYTRYVLSWRATQEAGPPGPPASTAPVINRSEEIITSTYVPAADGSTRVLWAGVKNSVGVVSIFTNPKNYTGDDSPLDNPLANLNRVFFDTRFNYINIVAEATVTLNFEFRDINKQSAGKKGKDTRLIPIEGEKIFTAYPHNLGYVPAGILYDLDNNQAISGNTFLQNIDNTSFRLLYLLADSTNFYIKERYFVRGFPLPAISKTFKVLTFSNPGGVV